MKKKSKINYGSKDLIDGELSVKDAKVKVTMYLDGDLLLEIRKQSDKHGKKYQSHINEILRSYFMKGSATVDPAEFKKLVKRVANLEKNI